MRVVVADAGPINYLILIGQIDLLPILFGQVTIPDAVLRELSHERAPHAVRTWVESPPVWLDIAAPSVPVDLPALHDLDSGETAAIALALSLKADLLPMDDRNAVMTARAMGFIVTGTLGVLDLAAEKGLADFAASIVKLARTTFRRPNALLAELLKKHG